MPTDSVTETTANARSSRRASLAGLLGSGFALLCCAGAAPVLGLLSAIGLGFLIHDAVLIPLLIVALGVTALGLRHGGRCHRRVAPLVVGVGGGAVAVVGLFFWVPLAFVGFATVILASVWNLRLLRACAVPSAVRMTTPTSGTLS